MGGHRRIDATLIISQALFGCRNKLTLTPLIANASDNAVQFYERVGFIRDGVAQNANGVLYNPMRLQADG